MILLKRREDASAVWSIEASKRSTARRCGMEAMELMRVGSRVVFIALPVLLLNLVEHAPH